MIDALRQLLTQTIVSSTIIALVLLIRRPVRHAFGAPVAYRLWLLLPIALVAMRLPGASSADSELIAYVQMEPIYSLVDRSLSVTSSAYSAISWSGGLLAAWAVGATIFLVYFIGLQRAYVKSLGKLSELRGVLRAERSAGCPALIGVFGPKVVLPRDFETRYTAQEQTLVLAHEAVHLHRRDTLWNALVLLLRCAFWFNPLIHVAAHFMRVDQELACDATVIVRHPASRRTYADAMLKTELADAALPVGCHWHSTHSLKERLHMLKTRLPSRARRTVGSALFAFTSVIVGFAAWAAEPASPGAQSITLDAAQVEATQARRLLHLKQGKLRVPATAVSVVSASTVQPQPEGGQILEGDVQIEIAPPANAAPQKQVMVLKTPAGVQTSEVFHAPRASTLKAEKVVLTQTENGTVTLDFEDGTIQEH
jgi:beta-lactamase regulating signal transducer with metallopeptidase domain